MSNYTQSTNFATKDALSPGDPLKIVRGTEINTEFANIAVAVATKLDTTALAAPGPIGATTPAAISCTSLNGGALAGLRNRVINGNFYNDQRNSGAAQTITAAAALAYTVDRFYAYCTGANVTGQRVAGTAPNAFLYRFTGAASVTKIGFAQRIENLNCQDLAGSTATLSVDLSNSLLTTVTWTAWRANTDNTFGTLASPTVTSIATGTFTVNSTLTRYNVNIAIPSAATTGIQIEFSVAAQISGTWNIGNVQLEPGPVATPFEQIPIGLSLALCYRYFQQLPVSLAGSSNPVSTVGTGFLVPLPVTMRISPTAVLASHITDANYVAATPTGSQWALINTNVAFGAKTGTVTANIASLGPNTVHINFTVATFNQAVNTLSSLLSIGSVSAEL